MANHSNIDLIKSYFEERFNLHGTSPRGVDWNSKASQEIRFDQLLKICNSSAPLSILDYGCGYGALADYLVSKSYNADYYGYDIVEQMIITARKHHAGKHMRTFFADKDQLPVCDYVVASGIFNVRFNYSFEAWTEYVIGILHHFNDLSRKGFSFNMLTKYSDADRMRTDLYYADPCFMFDYCKTNFTRSIALLHDYPLYDFTILVHKE